MNDLNLLATFDELAARQPDVLARELQDAGIPTEAIQTAQAELSVALAGMRSAVNTRRTSLAAQLGWATEEDITRIVASERERLDEQLKQDLKDARQIEQEARDARAEKVSRLINAGASDALVSAARAEALPPPIDAEAIRKRNAAYLATLPDKLRSRSAKDERAVRDLLEGAVADAVANVAESWLALYLRANRAIDAQLQALIGRARERAEPSELALTKLFADKPLNGERERLSEPVLPDGVTMTPIFGHRGNAR